MIGRAKVGKVVIVAVLLVEKIVTRVKILRCFIYKTRYQVKLVLTPLMPR